MEIFGGSTRTRYWFVFASAVLICLVVLSFGATLATAATTLVVTTTADSGASGGACGTSSITSPPSPLSLREAICVANNLGGEVTVTVPAGTYKLSSGQLTAGVDQGQTVSIIGAGAASTVINGQGQSRVLNFDRATVGGVKATVKGLTITGGDDETSGGGGIAAGSSSKYPPDELILEDDVFRGNIAGSTTPGLATRPGGAVQMSGGQLTVLNSRFTENRTFGSSGSAISTTGYSETEAGQGLKVVGSTFTANKSGSSVAEAPVGGAIYIDNLSGESEITESTFTGNEVNGSSRGAWGGAIYEDVGSPLTVTRSTFAENKVSAEVGGKVSAESSGKATGSAIELRQTAGQTLVIRYDRFHGNNTGVAVGGRSSFKALDDWWGCNAGPGNAGCDGVGAETGSVTTAPRLQFRAVAASTTVVGPGGTDALSASFTSDSAGSGIAAANLAAFEGAAVTWSDPQPAPATINGRAAPETATTSLAEGQTSAAYESASSSGSGHAVAAFDNASVTLPLTVYQRAVVTGNPSNQSVATGSTVSFSASASGIPAPTVQWERNDGRGYFLITGATSPTYTFTASAGETGYLFRASFTNTIEGSSYRANSTAATLTVSKARPTLTTLASSSGVGGLIHDTATLAGGESPTGTITFSVFAPGDTACATPLATSSRRLAGSGGVESEAITPNVLGEYRWTAAYSGDASNEATSEGCNAPNESSTVGRATPSLSGIASGTMIGGAIQDRATMAGGFAPGGTITFRAFAAGDTGCAGEPAFSSMVEVTGNGSYESAGFTPATVGEYRWIVTYSGDANNVGVGGACNAPNQKSTVAKATPRLAAVASSATVGGVIEDRASLLDGDHAGGTVTFEAFAPGDRTCVGEPAFTSTATVPGDGSVESAPFTPGTVGQYRWTVTYSGDAANQPASLPCNYTNQQSTVAKAVPSLSSTATDATLGFPIHDTATIAGGDAPGGTVTFRVFSPGDTACSGAPAFSGTVAVSGAGGYGSGNFTPDAIGEYRWTATYSGDADNEAAVGACNAADETSTVAKARIFWSLTTKGAVYGEPIDATMGLSGGHRAGGTITFAVFGPGNPSCVGAPDATSTVAVVGNGEYDSADFMANMAGEYFWSATYSGDRENEGVVTPCGFDTIVARASSAISTTAADGTVGGAVHDTATITGGPGMSGVLTFDAFGPDDVGCTGPATFTKRVVVSGGGEYGSTDLGPVRAAGEYRWTVDYAGDQNYAPASSPCNAANEKSLVAKASPTISTTATSASLGNPVHDVATIAGAQGAGGTITFRVFGAGDPTCDAAALATGVVTVDGNGDYDSPSFEPASIGEYRWTASYSGDANNEPVTSPCNAPGETSTVAKATTRLTTEASDAPIGGSLEDLATLTGGHGAGGAITFAVYGPDDATCSGPVVYTRTVVVEGDGAYPSGPFTPTRVGTYRWVASYSGDAENEGVVRACDGGGETSTVAPARPTLSTLATDALLGGSIHDTATLAGGRDPGGTLTFEAFGPDDQRCAGTAAVKLIVAVSGNGSYSSGDFSPTAEGAYRWVVTYSGDSENELATGACGEPGETSNVTAGPSEGSWSENPPPEGSSGEDPRPAGSPGEAPAPASSPGGTSVGTSPSGGNPPAASPAGEAATTVSLVPCMPAVTSGRHRSKAKGRRSLVAGVRARIHLATRSDLAIAATLIYRRGGKARRARLGTSALQGRGERSLRMALPAALRKRLPLGSKVRLMLAMTSVPLGGSCAEAKRTRLRLKTKVVKVRRPQ